MLRPRIASLASKTGQTQSTTHTGACWTKNAMKLDHLKVHVLEAVMITNVSTKENLAIVFSLIAQQLPSQNTTKNVNVAHNTPISKYILNIGACWITSVMNK